MKNNVRYLNDLIFEWLEEVRASRAPSTHYKYQQLCRKHIYPFFEKIAITQITRIQLEDFRTWLVKLPENNPSNPHSMSIGNIKCIFMILNGVLLKAYQEGVIKEPISVCAHKRKENHIVKVLETEERQKLETYLLENMDLSRLGIYLCLYTGLRLGEICSLHWQDINMDNGYIHIKHTVQRLPSENKTHRNRTKLVMSYPKSITSARVIPISSNLFPYLSKYKAVAEDEHFFLTNRPEPLEPRTFQYRYKRCLTQAGLPYVNFHTIRHTFATRCIMCGIDPKTLSEMLGHSDIKITLDYYFHSSLEFKKTQIERLCALSWEKTNEEDIVNKNVAY